MCGREDSNLQALSGTCTSSMRVYQIPPRPHNDISTNSMRVFCIKHYIFYTCPEFVEGPRPHNDISINSMRVCCIKHRIFYTCPELVCRQVGLSKGHVRLLGLLLDRSSDFLPCGLSCFLSYFSCRFFSYIVQLCSSHPWFFENFNFFYRRQAKGECLLNTDSS